MGRRMGGVDKGLVELDGRPMVAHVLERLAPQVGAVLINANQNADRYAASGIRWLPTRWAALPARSRDCTPASRARDQSCRHRALRFAVSAGRSRRAPGPGTLGKGSATRGREDLDQPHPVFALVRRDVLPHLAAFLAAGGRKIDAWYGTLRIVEVAFDDEADAFRNINTVAELAAASTTGGR